jgi:hypothetical protein
MLALVAFLSQPSLVNCLGCVLSTSSTHHLGMPISLAVYTQLLLMHFEHFISCRSPRCLTTSLCHLTLEELKHLTTLDSHQQYLPILLETVDFRNSPELSVFPCQVNPACCDSLSYGFSTVLELTLFGSSSARVFNLAISRGLVPASPSAGVFLSSLLFGLFQLQFPPAPTECWPLSLEECDITKTANLLSSPQFTLEKWKVAASSMDDILSSCPSDSELSSCDFLKSGFITCHVPVFSLLDLSSARPSCVPAGSHNIRYLAIPQGSFPYINPRSLARGSRLHYVVENALLRVAPAPFPRAGVG